MGTVAIILWLTGMLVFDGFMRAGGIIYKLQGGCLWEETPAWYRAVLVILWPAVFLVMYLVESKR